MNRTTKTLIAASLAAGALTLGAAQWAVASPGARGDCYGGRHAHMMHHDGGDERHLDRMTERLGLSDAQRAAVRDIFSQSQPQLREVHDKLRANREALRALTAADALDENRLRTLAQEQGQLHAEMIVQRSRVHSEIHKVLTPEQRERMQERRGKFSEKKGRS
jgi:periplasmic protein CpxP/Spy